MSASGSRPPGGGYSGLLLSLAVLVILAATLTPAAPDQSPTELLCLLCGEAPLAQALLNVLLFLPLGLALRGLGYGAGGALVVGGALSIAIELVQLAIPGRSANTGDVVMNALGAGCGSLAFDLAHALAHPSRQVARRLAVGSAVLAGSTLWLTALALAPSFPDGAYWGGWAPDLGGLEQYRGTVLAASLGDLDLPDGVLPRADDVRRRLLAGDPLRVELLAGPRPSSLAPIVTIHDEHSRELLLLGVEGEDLVYRFRTRAAAGGLDAPSLRLTDALRRVEPGARAVVTVSRRSPDFCLDVDRASTCGLGFTVGMGWSLLLYAQSPAALGGALDCLWLAMLAFPAGFWARSDCERLGVALVLGAGLLLPPLAPALLPIPPIQIAAIAAGLLAGSSLAAWFPLRPGSAGRDDPISR